MVGSHKYVKRTGSPGAYRYWYKLPNGSIVEGNDAQQKQGRIEHVKRLIAGKQDGVHDRSAADIARETGHDPEKVRSLSSNAATAKRQGKHHGFERSHLVEAHQQPFPQHAEEEGDDSESSRETPSTARPTPAASSTAPASVAAPAAAERPDNRPSPAATPAEDPREARKKELLKKLKVEHGIDLSSPVAASAENPSTGPSAAETPEPIRPSAAAGEAERARKMSKRISSTPATTAAPTESASAAPAATPHPDSSSTTPHGQELVRFDPDFAASEEATNKMIEQQQQGANPYLTRAVDVFGKIMNDVKEPRKTNVRNMLNAIVKAHSEAQGGGATFNKDLVLAHYKAMPGNERVRSLPADDFDKATFHTLDEVIENKPIDPEIERMKRGFAMKQFVRLQPFLSDTFKSANPSAPPPYPTYNDLRSWGDHKTKTGEDRPSWAGGTENMRQGQKKAMPKEFFDSIEKGTDGKPAMPPGWMPLHLAPVWNYTVKSKGSVAGYAGTQISPESAEAQGVGRGQNQRLSIRGQSPTDAEVADGSRTPESILMMSLRKYVQARGGVSQLIDIPSNKIPAGTNLKDLFKSDKELSDAELQKVSTHKIIDPVGLMKFVTKELGVKPKNPKKGVKKSIELVVDMDEEYVPGDTLIKSIHLRPRSFAGETVMKSENGRRISRIQEELRARGL